MVGWLVVVNSDRSQERKAERFRDMTDREIQRQKERSRGEIQRQE
jgi:hypothetical protein